MLATHGLGLTLGNARVLDEVTVSFAPGRVSALLGPNGAGKSSLLACLAALVVPDRGSATLAGEEVAGMERRDRARRIGLLPQAGDVHWDIDVRTLVGLGRLPHRGRWGETAEDRTAIDRAMAATDVARLAGRGVGHLSGGERSRVLLARVLAGEPDWLLADEPLAGLDPAHQIDVAAMLRGVAASGRGVVLVVHNLGIAAQVADDVVLLRNGRVVATGAAETVLTAPLIGETYGITVEIGETAGGARYILPTATR